MATETALISDAVLQNAQAARERAAQIFGAATAQRLLDETRVVQVIRDISRGAPHDPGHALAEMLARLSVGIVHGADPQRVIEFAIATLADFSGALEIAAPAPADNSEDKSADKNDDEISQAADAEEVAPAAEQTSAAPIDPDKELEF